MCILYHIVILSGFEDKIRAVQAEKAVDDGHDQDRQRLVTPLTELSELWTQLM